MRIEANNLQEAFQKAAAELNCSVTELDIKVIQNPSAGFLGFFKRTAIIEAVKENKKESKDSFKDKKYKKDRSEIQESRTESRSESGENKARKFEKLNDKKRSRNKKRNYENKDDRRAQNLNDKELKFDSKSIPNISDNAFKFDETEYDDGLAKNTQVRDRIDKEAVKNILDNSIIDTFNRSDYEEKDEPGKDAENQIKEPKTVVDIDKILPEIKEKLTALINASCFAIDKIEVGKFNDECILIELDGDDAALLIGKEGYRYKALSYMIYNWINLKYGILIRLEIAEFLKNQEAAMDEYLKGVIQRAQVSKKTKTKPLDGILVKIALEKLRDKFPDKYVGIKRDGDKQFVVINDFVKKQ